MIRFSPDLSLQLCLYASILTVVVLRKNYGQDRDA
jgi:hypothetical protein